MFVQQNTLAEALDYMKSNLVHKFSNSEIRTLQRTIFEEEFGCSASDLILGKDQRLSESDLLRVRAFVKRLLADEPLQYIIGHTIFGNLKIKCDARALIPRPETEELVFKILDNKNNFIENPKVLDVCTGSGCIALALKSHWPTAIVSALDISEDALSLAKENAENVCMDVNFLQVDALQLNDDMRLTSQNWDIIVSNPPYIPNKDKAIMHENVLAYEPALALFVEDFQPIVFYEKIIEFASKHLTPSGLLAFELHESYTDEVAECCSQNSFSTVEIFKDLQGKSRMLLAQF